MKVGDLVTITGSYDMFRVCRITGETKLYWLVGSMKFRKSNLYAIGTDKYISYRIAPTTQADIDEVRRRKLVSNLQSVKWEQFDLNTLMNVQATLCGLDTKTTNNEGETK